MKKELSGFIREKIGGPKAKPRNKSHSYCDGNKNYSSFR